jgi:hypothetical protein
MPIGHGPIEVILTGISVFYLLAAGIGDKQARAPIVAQGMSVTVRQQIIIRGPAAFRGGVASEDLVEWREGHGPRCVAARNVIGAARLGQDSVDLIFRDTSRMRAQLEQRCPALDFYRGFYVNATGDGMICADRDSIHSRAGGECQIDRFRSLRPRH